MNLMDRRALLVAAAAASALAQDRPTPPAAAPAARPDDWVALPGKTPHSRFAVNVETWFRAMPLFDRVRAVADLGFDAIEIWGLGGKNIDELASLCDELKLEVAQFTAWGFSPGLNDPASLKGFLQAVESACDAAQVLSARKATVVAGNDQPGMSSLEMHEYVSAALKLAAPIVEERQLMLILEPMNIRVDHPGHCLYGSADALRICRQVASPMVKINWDLYHMQISEGDLCGHLRDGMDQVGYLQVADHPGRNEPGTGEIQYSRVLREALALGYKDIIGLECYPQAGEELAAQRVHRVDNW